MKTLPSLYKPFIIGFLSSILFLSINIQSFGQENLLTQPGHFYVGCNYWASHAGTHMWRDWKPEFIEQDFKLLSENGIRVLRVFPLWPDFQPIHQIYSGGGSKKFIGFKDAPLPSVKGLDAIFKDSWYKILDKVKEGATLYLSLDFVYMPTLTSPLGIEIKTNIQRRGTLKFLSKIGNDSLNFETSAERRLNIDPMKCTVLGREADGNPAFIMSEYGKGKIYLLTFPLETNLATTTGAFDSGMPAWYRIYSIVAKDVTDERVLTQNNPYVGVTEHSIGENEKVTVLINYNYKDGSADFRVKDGWKISEALYGKIPSGQSLTIQANDAVIFRVRKN